MRLPPEQDAGQEAEGQQSLGGLPGRGLCLSLWRESLGEGCAFRGTGQGSKDVPNLIH